MKKRPFPPVLIAAALLLSACAAPTATRPAAGRPPAAPGTPAPPAAAAGTPSAGRTVTLAVAGDINLGRGVGDVIARRGVDHPFAAVAERLGRADLAFASLESPAGVKGSPLPGKGSLLRARPETLAALRRAGIDGVTVASNHIFDYGAENFLETLSILKENGIPFTGGGANLAAARRPLVLEAGGLRVAFLGYSQFADDVWSRSSPIRARAGESSPGVAPLDERMIAEDIARARREADRVAVALHWGEENVNHPAEAQRRLAHRLVDAGADLVLGFHPHAVQGLERYKGALIAYSLGNFVFDLDREINREGMILEIRLGREGVLGYEVVPVRIADGQPRVLEGAAAARLRAKIEALSFPATAASR